MLLRPVLPHIIGRDFIIRPTHFTNCQNVKPTTARIAYIPSAADSEKTILTHRDFIILVSERGKTRNKDRDYPLTSAMTSVSVSALAGIH